MVNVTTFSTLSEDQLNVAYLQESLELSRYRAMALSFLTFDTSISGLMSTMATECEQRLCHLQEIATRMGVSLTINVSPLKEVPSYYNNSRHFFVVDEHMGRQILVRAEEAAEATCGVFDRMLNTNAIPDLHRSLTSFVAQKNSERRVLQECLEQWGIGLSEQCVIS